jgi:hypothetical protein
MSDKVELYKRLVVNDRTRLANQCSGNMFLRSPVNRLP